MTNLESQVERARHDLFLARKLEELTNQFTDKVPEAIARLEILQAELDAVNREQREILARFEERNQVEHSRRLKPLLTPCGDTMLVNGRWVDSSGGFNQ